MTGPQAAVQLVSLKVLGSMVFLFVSVETGNIGAVEARSDATWVNGIATDTLGDAYLHFDALVSFEKRLGRTSVSDEHGAVGVEEETSEIVLTDSPLATERSRLFDELSMLVFVAISRLGVIHPVVDGGHHAVGFVLHVSTLEAYFGSTICGDAPLGLSFSTSTK